MQDYQSMNYATLAARAFHKSAFSLTTQFDLLRGKDRGVEISCSYVLNKWFCSNAMT